MKKINIKIILLISFIAIISMILPINVEAAGNFSISKSSASLTKGNTTTITITASNCAGQFTVSSSNSNVATASQSSFWLDNSSTTITVTAKSAGSATISIKAVDVTDTDLNEVTGTKTCSVKVSNPVETKPPAGNNSGSTGSSSSSTSSKPSNSGSSSSSSSNNNKPTVNTTKPKEEEKKSSDSTLKALVIEGQELYPVFNTNTREYNVRVENNITKIKVAATVNDEKATYKIQGTTEELLVGKNVITVIVTAEDGTTSNYVLNVTRDREGLSVKHIKIFYTDEAGIKQELVLNPMFSVDILEYTLNNVSYLISKLDVEVLANFEEAKIEITGNENLAQGENLINIKVTMPSESEEETDEALTYTIKVNKEKEPVVTLMGKIQNWFSGITGTVSTWFSENLYEILMGSLVVCSFAMGGLSVYLVSAYKKYKLILQKVAELTRLNNAELVNMVEEKQKTESIENEIEPEERRKGRHF